MKPSRWRARSSMVASAVGRRSCWPRRSSSAPECASEAIGASELLSRSEEHTSELQSLMRISYAVFCLKKKTNHYTLPYHKYRNHTIDKLFAYLIQQNVYLAIFFHNSTLIYFIDHT